MPEQNDNSNLDYAAPSFLRTVDPVSDDFENEESPTNEESTQSKPNDEAANDANGQENSNGDDVSDGEKSGEDISEKHDEQEGKDSGEKTDEENTEKNDQKTEESKNQPQKSESELKIEQLEREKQELEKSLQAAKGLTDPEKQKEAGEVNDELGKFLELATKQSFIPSPDLNPEHFYNNKGEFQIHEYMQSAFSQFAVNLQQAILQGPLAAAQFELMGQAINETHSESRREEESTAWAMQINNELETKYPILKENAQVAAMYDRLLQGELIARTQEWSSNPENQGKPMPRPEFADFEKVLTDFLQIQPGGTTTEEEQEKVETPKRGASLNGGTPTAKDPVESDIDDMFATKKRGSIF